MILTSQQTQWILGLSSILPALSAKFSGNIVWGILVAVVMNYAAVYNYYKNNPGVANSKGVGTFINSLVIGTTVGAVSMGLLNPENMLMYIVVGAATGLLTQGIAISVAGAKNH